MILPKKKMLLAVGIIIALIVISFLWIQFSGNNNPENNELESLDVNSSERLPFVKLTVLEKTDCVECISLQPLVDSIKFEFDVNVLDVKTIDSASAEGQDLIKMHNIKFLPVVIVNGEFDGTDLQLLWSEIGTEKNGVLIQTKGFPPYYSLEEKRLVGKVNILHIINSSCEECIDLSFFASDLNELGVLVGEEKTIEFDSIEGKDLLDFYLIDRIPTVLLSGDISEYEYLSSIWTQIGSIEADGIYIFNEAVPYYDLFSGETKGLVEVIKLVDLNCSECMEADTLMLPLNEMQMKIVKETIIDVSSEEGKALIEKYLIQAVPTIIVSAEAEEYLDFFVLWPELGSQEEDGSFVFRNLEVVGQPFKTLE